MRRRLPRAKSAMNHVGPSLCSLVASGSSVGRPPEETEATSEHSGPPRATWYGNELIRPRFPRANGGKQGFHIEDEKGERQSRKLLTSRLSTARGPMNHPGPSLCSLVARVSSEGRFPECPRATSERSGFLRATFHVN
eukprot:6616084-Pyramimonas_sp.AAC.1